jgi:hypothetical protein
MDMESLARGWRAVLLVSGTARGGWLCAGSVRSIDACMFGGHLARGVWLIGYIHGKRASLMQRRRAARVGVAPCRRVVVAMEAAASSKQQQSQAVSGSNGQRRRPVRLGRRAEASTSQWINGRGRRVRGLGRHRNERAGGAGQGRHDGSCESRAGRRSFDVGR